MLMKWSKEDKSEAIRSIQSYFWDERGEEIGELAAEGLLQFVIENIGPHLYNKGVDDAKKMTEDKMMNLEEDLESLKRRT
ncbi:DUF2164 domain-containing protein [Fictibacillus iocasae]|uniref:DUF2164 domain-containing protein n=1 Tax=Fictibacillus iocasae TaxID=2715437 RepID=A0ABW2NKV6_9BACL